MKLKIFILFSPVIKILSAHILAKRAKSDINILHLNVFDQEVQSLIAVSV